MKNSKPRQNITETNKKEIASKQNEQRGDLMPNCI